MGWNSWNHLGKAVTDAEVREAADMLVATGMRNAGYIDVNLDGSWEGYRLRNRRFVSALAALRRSCS